MQVPDQAAVWADFAHISTVKGRKVCILTIEAPLEDLFEVLKRLGNPVGADSIPVAIVRIDPKAVAAALDVKPPEAAQVSEANGSSKSPKPRKWEEMPLSAQAAIRCGEPAFRKFLANQCGQDDFTEAQAAEDVRLRCDVKSRSEIVYGDKSADYWLDLEANYQRHLTDKNYGGLAR